MPIWFGLVVVILTFASACLVAVLSFRNVQHSYLTLNSLHKRQADQLDKTLDRLMTVDWERFAALSALSDTDEGGFIPPEDQTTLLVDEDEDNEPGGQWGALRGVSGDEMLLLNEDFPEED